MSSVLIDTERAARLLARAAEVVRERALGDFEGHPFRGNQYTGGLASYNVDPSVPRAQRDKIRKALDFVEKEHAEHLGKIHIFVAPTGKGNTNNPHGYTKRNIKVEGGKPVRDEHGNLVHTGKYTVYISSKQSSTEDFVRTIAHEFEHVSQWERGEEPHEGGAMSAGSAASRKFRGLGGPGSGNFGHAGRPGEVGGSAAANHESLRRDISDMSSRLAERGIRVQVETSTDPLTEPGQRNIEVMHLALSSLLEATKDPNASSVSTVTFKAVKNRGESRYDTVAAKATKHTLTVNTRHPAWASPVKFNWHFHKAPAEYLQELLAGVRTLAASGETPLHAAADAHVAKLEVAVRYAFAVARKAMAAKLKTPDDLKMASALAVVTLRQELKDVLPKRLLAVYREGGKVGAEMLAEGRNLGDYEGHPFRGNQWTEGEVIADDELLAIARKDSEDMRHPHRGDIESDVQGVIVGSPRALDKTINRGENTLEEVKKDFEATRDYLRSKYGEDLVLYRVDVPAEKHAKGTLTVYMGDKKLANRFGKARPYNVKIDEVVAVYATKSGYYEFIVEKPKEGLRALGDFEGHPFRGNQWTDNPEPLPVTKVREHNFLDGNKGFVFEFRKRGTFQGKVGFITSGPKVSEGTAIVKFADAWEGKGKGFGTRMYFSAFQELSKRGLTSVISDDESGTTPDAVRVWESLVRRGIAERSGEKYSASLTKFRTAKRETKPKPKHRGILGFLFDAKRQAAIDWADRHAAELIDGISETSREAINNAVAEYLETGDWKEYRTEILAAVGDVKRANLIARNESMVAVHAGQREAWSQAVDAGLLTGREQRVWITVGDEKTCPICGELEGKTAGLGGQYPGGYDGPPAHVSCRCSEGIAS